MTKTETVVLTDWPDTNRPQGQCHNDTCNLYIKCCMTYNLMFNSHSPGEWHRYHIHTLSNSYGWSWQHYLQVRMSCLTYLTRSRSGRSSLTKSFNCKKVKICILANQCFQCSKFDNDFLPIKYVDTWQVEIKSSLWILSIHTSSHLLSLNH